MVIQAMMTIQVILKLSLKAPSLQTLLVKLHRSVTAGALQPQAGTCSVKVTHSGGIQTNGGSEDYEGFRPSQHHWLAQRVTRVK